MATPSLFFFIDQICQRRDLRHLSRYLSWGG